METRTEREPLLPDEELRARFDMVRRLRRDLPPDQLDRFVEGYGSGARWMEELMNERITSGTLRVVEKGPMTNEQTFEMLDKVPGIYGHSDGEKGRPMYAWKEGGLWHLSGTCGTARGSNVYSFDMQCRVWRVEWAMHPNLSQIIDP